MKARKAKAVPRPLAVTASPRVPGRAREHAVWALAIAAAALALVFWAYGPAMHGGFLFDDTLQRYARPAAPAALAAWIGAVRPVLMFTYWVNSRLSGQDTYSFHAVNALLHWLTSILIFLIIRRLMEHFTDL